MSKPIGNLAFAIGVSFLFAAAIGVVIWAMPVWMIEGVLAQWQVGGEVTQLAWALGLDARLIVAGAGAGLALITLSPPVWMGAQLIWPSRRRVTVPPLPDRATDAVDERLRFPAFHPVAPDPILELPKFLSLSNDVAEPIVAQRAPDLSSISDHVLIIEPAPVQPPLAGPTRPASAAPSDTGDDSMADLLERFEQRLTRVGRRRDAVAVKGAHGPTSSLGLPAFAAAGRH